MAEMAQAAQDRGLEYLAITEHSKRLTVAHGLVEARLDLSALHCQMAKAERLLVSINSDVHSMNDFYNLHYGVSQARRGWLEKNDVLNTRPLTELRRLIDNR